MARIAKETGNRGANKVEAKEKRGPKIYKDLKSFLKACNEYRGVLVTPQEAATKLDVTRACIGNWALTRGKVKCFRYQSEFDKNGIMLVDWQDCIDAKNRKSEKAMDSQMKIEIEEI